MEPQPGDSTPSKDHALEEYRQVNENLRFYGNLRFAQLTLFFVATGALLAALDGSIAVVPVLTSPVLAVGGLILVLVFAILEQSAVKYWCHYRERAIHLEQRLGLDQYSKRPRGSFLNATNAVRLLFLSASALWMTVGVSWILG